MIVRALDDNGDWTFGKGINDYKKNKDATAQSIGTRLNSFLSDCFFNLTGGLDWFNLLGAKDQVALNLATSASILNTPNVIAIQQILIDLSNQLNLTIKYNVSTVYGPINGALNTATLANFLTTESGDILSTEDGDGIII